MKDKCWNVGKSLLDSNPVVSVGIPCYNRPGDLRVTLEDITGQTYKNLEIVISNNCSSDPEVEVVAQEFAAKDSRIKYHFQQENLGVLNNFKFLIGATTGELFMWACDDDRWHEEFVETCLLNMQEGTKYSVMTDYLMENRTVEWLRTSPWFPKLKPEKGILANILAYSNSSTDTLYYGLHHREGIQVFVDHVPSKEFEDPLVGYYLLLKMLVKTGFKTLKEPMFVWRCDVEKGKPRYGPPNYEYDFIHFWRIVIKYLVQTEKLVWWQRYLAVLFFTFGFGKRFVWNEMQQGNSLRARVLKYSLVWLKKPIHYLVIQRWKIRNKKIKNFAAQ